eukprot:XP_001708634.1 Hypothetical protein GL50803_106128 [Giardia lamblia ATCC 50803]
MIEIGSRPRSAFCRSKDAPESSASLSAATAVILEIDSRAEDAMALRGLFERRDLEAAGLVTMELVTDWRPYLSRVVCFGVFTDALRVMLITIFLVAGEGTATTMSSTDLKRAEPP